MMYIKIYGERNTGTNYLQRLIRLNFDQVVLLRNTAPKYVYKIRREWLIDVYFDLTAKQNLGWKHTCPDSSLIKSFARTKPLLVLTLTKNPYSFLLSLHKKPYHSDTPADSFTEFLKTPWPPVRRDGCRDIRYPVDLWNRKNASYLELEAHGINVLNLTYEELVVDPASLIRRIGRKSGHEITDFQNVKKSTKEKGKDFDYYQDYYQNERWREKLTPEALQEINRHLDPELMRRFNYERIETL